MIHTGKRMYREQEFNDNVPVELWREVQALRERYNAIEPIEEQEIPRDAIWTTE